MDQHSDHTAVNKLPTAPAPPQKKPKRFIDHGRERVDPWYWLRERDNPEVRAHLERENAYTQAWMGRTGKLREKLFDEITGRIAQTDMTVPYMLRDWVYYVRYIQGGEYPLYCRRSAESARLHPAELHSPESDSPEVAPVGEQIMIDGNREAKDQSFYQVAGRSVSPDNRLLVYGVDTVGRRQYTLKFRDLTTGDDLPDRIENTVGSAVWANDNRSVFYTVKDPETLRASRIYRHVLGQNSADDVLVYEETDDTFRSFVTKSKSERYLVIGSHSTLSDEYRVLDADKPDGEFRVVQARERELEYGIAHYGEHFYVLTNLDARNFRLMRTPVEQTGKDNWEEVIPHSEDTLLENLELFSDYLVVAERHRGSTQLRVIPWDTKRAAYLIEPEEAASVMWIDRNPAFDSRELRYGYASLTTPTSIYDYDLGNRKQTLRKRQEVVGGHDAADYVSEQRWVTAQDGTEVPLSIVYRKGLTFNGDTPTVLYGYGAYGHSTDPWFSSMRLSLLDRGFVWAIAHVRGGQELGRAWYDTGKMFNKQNSFNDFADCARYLIAEGISRPEKLVGFGGSAGGLLVGAVANQAPELFAAIVAAVPFVDVITTMLDDSIPLTTGEFDEWGDPKKEAEFNCILSYSPYDNVRKQHYPALLATTGFHDSQVQYWEPAKWVLRLREHQTDGAPILLHTDMSAGHGGASGRFERHRDTALIYAFMIECVAGGESGQEA